MGPKIQLDPLLLLLFCMLQCFRGWGLRSCCSLAKPAAPTSRRWTPCTMTTKQLPLQGSSSSAAGAGAGAGAAAEEANSPLATTRIIGANNACLAEASQALREGRLVAFPTETVYGLGANALKESAVLSIFEAKKRPLTDPLIVHVPDAEAALRHLDFDCSEDYHDASEARRLFLHLGKAFWPGPLTLIARASKDLPSCVTASTGFVGTRCPDHPVAQSLLRMAAVPIAAPSANRFGHVSPTSAQHVAEDLNGSALLIVDGDAEQACKVGIESTVAKLDTSARKIIVLRRGAVSEPQIVGALGSDFPGFTVHTVVHGAVVGETVATQAPGQLLRHYAPDIDTYMVLTKKHVNSVHQQQQQQSLDDAVVLDFGGQLSQLRGPALAYRDLSPHGDTHVAAAQLFASLRWAEAQEGAKRLLLAPVPSQGDEGVAEAVSDRMFRAASGKTVRVDLAQT